MPVGLRKAVIGDVKQLLCFRRFKLESGDCENVQVFDNDCAEVSNEFEGLPMLILKELSAGMLSKSVHDAGWASFTKKVTYKAENAGRQLIAVNPAGTLQTCLCGASVRKALSDREHVCIACGLIAPRDVVSAQAILQRARISPSGVNEAEVIACVA